MNLKDMYAAVQVMSKFQDTQPENNVSLFLFETFDKLFPGEVQDLNVLKSMIVTFSNKDPEATLNKISEFMLLFQTWYLDEIEKQKVLCP